MSANVFITVVFGCFVALVAIVGILFVRRQMRG
jgi:hypothetical protein